MTLTQWEQPPAGTVNPRDVVDGWAVTFAGVARLAEFIAGTDFVPKAYRDQPAAVAAAILAGREMGIGPMASLQHLYVVEGRPAMSAQMMRALVMRDGHTFRVVESTASRCTVTGRRRGESTDREPVTWTGEEVRRAGLANRPTWQRYPRQMLMARATAELCRAVFPDVLGGMTYAVEEAADMPAEDGQLVADEPAPAKVIRRRATKAAPAAPEPQPPPTLPDRGEVAASPPTPAPPPGAGGDAPPPELPPLPDDAGPLMTREDVVAVITGDVGGVTTDPAQGAPGDDADDEASGRQRGHVFALLTELGVMTPRARRLTIVSALIGREIESMTQLTRAEATPLIDTLVRVKEGPDPEGELDALVAQGTARLVLGGRVLDEPLPIGDDDGPP